MCNYSQPFINSSDKNRSGANFARYQFQLFERKRKQTKLKLEHLRLPGDSITETEEIFLGGEENSFTFKCFSGETGEQETGEENIVVSILTSTTPNVHIGLVQKIVYH